MLLYNATNICTYVLFHFYHYNSPFIGNNYDHVNPIPEDNCFISIKKSSILIFICFYIPLWIIFAITFFFYLEAKKYLSSTKDITPKMKLYV